MLQNSGLFIDAIYICGDRENIVRCRSFNLTHPACLTRELYGLRALQAPQWGPSGVGAPATEKFSSILEAQDGLS